MKLEKTFNLLKYILLLVSFALTSGNAFADFGLYDNPADNTSLQTGEGNVFYAGTTIIEAYSGNIKLGISADNTEADKNKLEVIMRAAKDNQEALDALASITKTSEHFVMVNTGSLIGKKIKEFKLKYGRLPSGGIILLFRGRPPYKIPTTYQP